MLLSPRSQARPLAIFLACATCLAIAACGSSEPSSGGSAADAGTLADATTRASEAGHATVTGSVTNKSISPVEAFARKSNLYTPDDTSIYISSRGGICDVSKISPEGFANTTFLELDIPRSWPPPVGTYPVVPSFGTLDDGGITMGSFAYLIVTDATCKYVGSDDDSQALDGGAVTITTSTDALVTGDFDLQFRNGELRGTFSVPLCDVAYPSGSPKTCQP